MKAIALCLLRLAACAVLARGAAWVMLAGGKSITLGQGGLALLLFFVFLAAWREE